MFNGIIYNLGTIQSFKKSPRYVQGSLIIEVASNIKFKKNDVGESVCLRWCLFNFDKNKRNHSFFIYLKKP